MSLHAIVTAHEEGFAENMYLDAATRTKVEETGGANFIFVTKDGKVVTPKSNSILPSITRRSLMYVAKEYLGLEVEREKFTLTRLKILQSVVFAVQRLLSHLLAKSTTTAKKFVFKRYGRNGPCYKEAL